EEVGDPADAGLDRRHAELREAVEYPLEDELGDERHGVGEGARADGDPGLARGADLGLAGGEEEMDADRQVELRGGVPERVVLPREVVAAGGPGRDRHAAVA